jgi:hypothetical protein
MNAPVACGVLFRPPVRSQILTLFILAACTETGEMPGDSGDSTDSGAIDSGTIDSGTEPDAGFPDTGVIEVPAGWTELGGMPESSGRWGTRLVLVPPENRFLMFGGNTYPIGPTVGDLWSFSIADGTWTEIEATGDLPAPRYCHCATYLPNQHQMLLVGGRDDRGPRQPEAFLLDIDTMEWTQLSDPVPGGVIGCAIEWMENIGRAAVFGGARASLVRETWLYDPEARSFEMIATSSTPPGRADPAHAYDPVNGRMLVFGGGVRVVPPLMHLDDTWAFDGTDWVEITSAEHPSARRFPAFGVDAASGSWYVTGGTVETEDRDDVWRFDFATDTWTQLEDPELPPRGFASGEWDPVTRSLYVFGGLTQPNFSALSDGWRLRPE